MPTPVHHAAPTRRETAISAVRRLLALVALLAGISPLGAQVQSENESASPDGDANPRLVDHGIGTPEPELGTASELDSIWDLPILYHNDDAPLIQKFALLGRYHGQLWGVDSSQGSADGWDNRRVWLGARMRFLDELTLASAFNLDPRTGSGPTRNRDYIDTATLAWRRAQKFQMVIGHQKPGFTYEHYISSNEMLTPERSLLVNQLAPNKSPGMMLEQKLGKLYYRVGGYSGRPLGERIDDHFGLFVLAYDFSESTAAEKMGVHFYYLYNPEKDSQGAKPYEHAYSLSARIEDGPNSVLGEFMLADGIGEKPDAWGLTLMPARFIHEKKVQLVTRYQFASADGVDGLQAQSRYEARAPSLTNGGSGDRYHAGYLGLNWYLYDNRLKVMTGVEYSDLRGEGDGGGFSGWSGFAGLRLFF